MHTMTYIYHEIVFILNKWVPTFKYLQFHTIKHNTQPNSYTKIPKKIYYHKTKITVIMRDTFLKVQTSNRRSN